MLTKALRSWNAAAKLNMAQVPKHGMLLHVPLAPKMVSRRFQKRQIDSESIGCGWLESQLRCGTRHPSEYKVIQQSSWNILGKASSREFELSLCLWHSDLLLPNFIPFAILKKISFSVEYVYFKEGEIKQLRTVIYGTCVKYKHPPDLVNINTFRV